MGHKASFKASVFLVILLLLVIAHPAKAQFNASLSGTVQDSTGATIPKASITLTNLGTKQARTAISSEGGTYRFSQLDPGTYSVNATASGFKVQSVPSIAIEAETARSLDLVLQAGGSSETVTVSAESVPILQSSDASIGSTIGSEEVRRLPIFGANPYELLRTAPGITGDGARSGTGTAVFLPNGAGPGGSNSGIFQTENQTQIAADGQRAADNNYMIDGVSVNSLSHGGSAVVTPNQEAVESIAIVSTSYDAADGRNSGAQIKTVSRAGTNDVHGSLFFLYDEPGLNSYNKYGGPTVGALPARVQNKERSYIASLGGPMLKNKLFGFGSWQGYSQANNTTTVQTWVETQQYRQLVQAQRPGGVTTALFGTAGIQPRVVTVLNRGCADYAANQGLYPGQTASSGPWCQVMGNGIDIGSPTTGGASQIGVYPVDVRSTNTVPNAQEIGNGLDGIPDFQYVQLYTPSHSRGNQFNGRVDYHPTDRDSIAFSTFFTKLDNYTSPNASSRPQGDLPFKPLNSAATLIYIHTFSSSWLNELRANFTRFKDDQLADGGGLVNYGIPEVHTEGLPINAIQFGVPQGNGSSYAQNTFEMSDQVTHSFGSHNLRMGIQLRREQDNDDIVSSHVRPVYSFRGPWNLANDAPIFEGAAANPLTGGAPPNQNHLRSEYYGAFVQHDWKVTPSFTVNTGLRWELFTPLRNKDRQTYYPVLGPAGSEFTGLTLQPRDYFWQFTPHDFAPKVGFAYLPATMKGKMVVRGGFAMAYNHLDFSLFNTAQLDNGPGIANYSVCCGTAASPFAGGNIKYALGTSNSASSYPINPAFATGVDPVTHFPKASASGVAPATEAYGALPTTQPPYSYLYSLETQYELARQTSLAIGYSGSLGRHYARIVQQRFIYNTGGLGNSIYLAQTDSVQAYNGVNVILTRTMSKGLAASVSYTYSKALDQVSNGDGANSLANQTNPANNASEYGPADYDLRHRVTATALYELPHVHGNHLVQAVANGWQVNGIATYHTGFPFTPITTNISVPSAVTGADTVNPTRPRAVLHPYGTDCSTDALKSGANFSQGGAYYFDTTTLPPGTKSYLPGVGRNSLRSACYLDIDMSAAKEVAFDLLDHHSLLRFQANLYNAFNILSLAPILNGNADQGANILSPTFGRASQANAGRVIEFSARLQF
jgi:hypothetical protein